MQFEPTNPKEWLMAEFNRRRQKNPRYSLRMLGERMQIPSGRVSEILSGKRRLTPAMAKRAARGLGFNPETSERFLAAVEQTLGSQKDCDLNAGKRFNKLSTDTFYALSDWYHFAILSLIETSNFENDVRWIAGRLNIPTVQARSAIERMTRLGLIKEIQGTLVRGAAQLTTTHDLHSVALRNSHRQSLEQAIEALEEVPVELRDITSITLAADVSKLPKAKKMIRAFRRKLCAFLELSDVREQVYNINIQLVPVSKITD